MLFGCTGNLLPYSCTDGHACCSQCSVLQWTSLNVHTLGYLCEFVSVSDGWISHTRIYASRVCVLSIFARCSLASWPMEMKSNDKSKLSTTVRWLVILWGYFRECAGCDLYIISKWQVVLFLFSNFFPFVFKYGTEKSNSPALVENKSLDFSF
jgi:hypothetical protein